MGLLGEMLEVLNSNFQEGDGGQVTCILSQLAQCPRFSLSLSFLSAKENNAVSVHFENAKCLPAMEIE